MWDLFMLISSAVIVVGPVVLAWRVDLNRHDHDTR